MNVVWWGVVTLARARVQADQHRAEEIQYQNGLLLERMQAIMRQSVGAEDTVEFAPGVRITRSQIPVTDTFVSERTTMPGHAVALQSLVASQRKREQTKIYEENKVGSTRRRPCPTHAPSPCLCPPLLRQCSLG